MAAQFGTHRNGRLCETLRYLSFETQAQSMSAVRIDRGPRAVVPFISWCLPYVLFFPVSAFISFFATARTFIHFDQIERNLLLAALDFLLNLLHKY
jgi:hypothetical protein